MMQQREEVEAELPSHLIEEMMEILDIRAAVGLIVERGEQVQLACAIGRPGRQDRRMAFHVIRPAGLAGTPRAPAKSRSRTALIEHQETLLLIIIQAGLERSWVYNSFIRWLYFARTISTGVASTAVGFD